MCRMAIAGVAMVGSQFKSSQNQYEQASTAIGGAIWHGINFWCLDYVDSNCIGYRFTIEEVKYNRKRPNGCFLRNRRLNHKTSFKQSLFAAQRF